MKRIDESRAEAAFALGLIAKWSSAFGFISIHNPTTGTLRDVANDDVPPWAKWEARKRKELYRAGDHGAYRLSAEQMQDIWDDEHTQEEGIVEYHPDDESNPDPRGRSSPPDRAVV